MPGLGGRADALNQAASSWRWPPTTACCAGCWTAWTRCAAVGASTGGRLFLVGGGARSAAYRQRLADLSGRPVVVPDADEAVATGAALHAAVSATGESFAEIAARWHLGAGITIDPVTDARARRATYTAAIT